MRHLSYTSGVALTELNLSAAAEAVVARVVQEVRQELVKTGTQFTSTKVQKLTPEQHRERRRTLLLPLLAAPDLLPNFTTAYLIYYLIYDCIYLRSAASGEGCCCCHGA